MSDINDPERPMAPSESPSEPSLETAVEPSITESLTVAPPLADAPASPRPSKLRRFARGLFRWTKRGIIAVAILLLLVRVTLPLWLPRAIQSVAKSKDLHVSWQDLDLSILGLSLDLSGVRVVPLGTDGDASAVDTTAPLARLDDLGLDVDVSALLTGTLRVHRVEIGGIEAWLARSADGTWNFERHLGAGDAATEPDGDADGEPNATAEAEAKPTPEASSDDAPRASTLDFRSPVEIAMVDLHGVKLHVDDQAAAPELITTLEADVSLRDVGHEARPITLLVTARATDGVLSLLRIDGEVRPDEAALGADLNVELRGLGVRRLAPYLEALGIRPEANELNARLAATVDLTPLPAAGEADGDRPLDLSGTIALRDVVLDADGDPAVQLASLEVDVERANSLETIVRSVALSGVEAAATRLPDGVLRVAGLDLVGAPPKDEAPEDDEPEDDETEASGPSASVFEIASVTVEGVALTFDDRAIAPRTTLAVGLGAVIKDVVLDPARPGTPLSLALTASVQDAATFEIAGTATPTGDELGADLTLTGSDITLAALRPYLNAAGVETTLSEGALTGAITARIRPGTDGAPTTIEASLTGLALNDGDQEHLALGSLSITELRTGGDDGATSLASADLSGVSIPLELFANGAFRVGGIKSLGLADEAEGRDLSVSNLGARLEDFSLGGDGTRAKLDLQTAIAGVADSLTAKGSITSQPGPLDLQADIQLSGDAVRFDGLRELLAASGIEPTLESGTLRASATAHIAQIGKAMGVDARLFDVALEQNGAALVQLDEVRVKDGRFGPGAASIAEIAVVAPQLPVARRADGTLELLGLRIGAEVEQTDVAMEDMDVATQPAAAPATEPRNGDSAASEDPAPTTRFSIDRIALEGASIGWSDEAVSPAVATRLDCSALVTGFVTGTNEVVPIHVELTSAVDGVIEALTVNLDASLSPTDTSATVALDLTGLRAGPVASYLPPGVEVLFEDGRLAAQLSAGVTANEEGGDTIVAAVESLDLRDGEGGEPLLAFERLVLDAPRVDAAGGMFNIEEVAVRGFAFDVEKVDATRFRALGVEFDTAAAAPPSGTVTNEQESAEDPAEDLVAEAGDGSSDLASDASDAKPKPKPAAAPPAPGSAEPLPTVRLGKLDLGIDRLRYIDRTRADATPLDLALSVVTPEPQVLLQPDPVDLPPILLSIVGAVTPLVDTIEIAAKIEPFAADPGLALSANIAGITGEEIVQIAPELLDSIDPRGFVDGSFALEADARLAIARRSPVEFDMSRGFGATLHVEGVELRATPESDPTGFESFDVELKRFDPATGDMRFASIDLSGIRARIVQGEAGMEIAGLLLPNPPEEEAPAAEAAEAEAPDAESAEELAEDAAEELTEGAAEVAADPGPEIAIDRMSITGLDFAYTDTTTDPITILPIADMQLEVQRFTTRTLVEQRPFSFRLIVDAGEIELQERSGRDSLLTGVLGSIGNAAIGGGSAYKAEQRRLWDLFEVSGRMSLGPKPRGRVQSSLLGLELPAFRGMARAGGVDIGDGLLDNRTKVRFRDDGALGIDAKTTASYLSLSEPPDGPISRYLKLPAPLDTVLFLLRNDDGEQRIPVRLDIAETGITTSQIAAKAGTVLGVLVTDAVSSAPLRVLGPLGDIAGALGLTSVEATPETVALEFLGGVATVEDAAMLQAIATSLRANPDRRVVVQAVLGQADVDVAERLANPDRESIDALIARHRDRKALVERQRTEAAALAKAQYAVGAIERAEASTATLQALDGERREIEIALDQLFALIRPGAERRHEMRTRNAALALGRERLERVREALVTLAGPAAADRVDMRRPRYRKGKPDDPLPKQGSVTLTPK